MRYLSKNIKLPIIDIATLMMIISDNVATNVFIDFLGIDKINKTIQDIGCKDTKLFSKFKSVENEAFSETTAYDYYLVYCSPIERAKHTFKLLSLDKNIPVIIEDAIKERDMGVYENVSFEDLDWEVFWGYDSDLKYNKLESMKSVYKRVSNSLNELKLKCPNKNILLVTHGGVARAIY